VKSGALCVPQSMEMLKRAKAVMDMWLAGELPHEDLAYYFQHCNSNYTHQKLFMKRKDAMDAMSRLEMMWPLKEEDQIPPTTKEGLPVELQAMTVGAYKIEWHYEGRIQIIMSDEYKAKYKFRAGKNRPVYRKCIDTMGFADYTMAMKMWLESLHRPGHVINYRGKAIVQINTEPVVQTATVVSLVWDYNHFITLTQIKIE